MLYKIVVMRAGRARGNIPLLVPAPHIFGGDLYSAGPCERQKLLVYLGVFLCAFIVIGVDYADPSPCLSRAFERPFVVPSYFGTVGRKGGV